MIKDLLKRYLNNCYTQEDLNIVSAWVEESAESEEGKALLYEIWNEIPEEGENYKTNFDILLDKIHHKVNLHQTEMSDNRNDPDRSKSRTFMMIIRNAAAILMLPVLGYGLYMTSKYNDSVSITEPRIEAYNEVFSSADAITKVTLPDGSNVWLNHSSTLRYPANFREQFRRVELKGEGYFEVAHNPDVPFIVETGEIEIVALGTTFNILAYPEEDKIETSLICGTVKVQSYSDKGFIESFEMKPADQVVYKRSSREIITRTILDDKYFSWKEGKLVFIKEPMGEVVKKLNRWFNVDIQIQDPELLELTFTGTFMNERLRQVLELLEMVTPVKYSFLPRQESSPGIYHKRIVMLEYRK